MHRFIKWREVLQQASSVKAVESIMRDYLAELGPIVETFPAECKAALDYMDVQAAAVALLREELRFEGSDEARAFLHEAAHTFASAAVRITLLHARPVASAT